LTTSASGPATITSSPPAVSSFSGPLESNGSCVPDASILSARSAVVKRRRRREIPE
jgi:hypothetical protein